MAKSIAKQIDSLDTASVWLYPQQLTTPLEISQEGVHTHIQNRILGFPLPAEFRPRKDDFAKLVGTHLTLYDQQYCLINAQVGKGYNNFIWNVCRTFVKLGYLPPVLISDLIGSKENLKDEDVIVVGACKRSLAHAKLFIEKTISGLSKSFGI